MQRRGRVSLGRVAVSGRQREDARRLALLQLGSMGLCCECGDELGAGHACVQLASSNENHLSFFLHIMDVLAEGGHFGSPVYLWAVAMASDGVEWTTT